MKKINENIKEKYRKIIDIKKSMYLKKDITIELLNLAELYISIEKYEKAFKIYDKALILNQGGAEIYYLKGNLYLDLKEYKKSINEYEICLNLNPDKIEAICNKGIAFYSLGEYEKSIYYFDQVILKNTKITEAYYNRGNAYQALYKFNCACNDYDEAIKLRPYEPEFYYSKANALQEEHRFKDALKYYDDAIKLKPDHVEARINKSLTLLMIGKYSEGFKLYEWRSKKKINFQRELSNKRKWDGRESLKNKKILITNEQGFGDFIQFIRLLETLKTKECKILLETPKSMVGIVRSINYVDQIVQDNIGTAEFDYYCSLLSLPSALKLKINHIPNKVPYIFINEKKLNQWNKIIKSAVNMKKIGLIWRGSTNNDLHLNKNLTTRKIKLNDLLESLSNKHDYYSIQKDIDEDERKLLEKYNIKNHMADVEDFADTGSICTLMDTIITIDTSVAHLAGALGLEVWLLLPFHCDWRWMSNKDNLKWYPTIKIYQQNKERNWKSVLSKLKKDLEFNG